jgi:transcriptional regulator with XRE-family HTH domain
MRERGMTQSELAEMAGVTKAAMSAYVNGRRQMGVSALNGICDALGCTWHDLMKDVV